MDTITLTSTSDTPAQVQAALGIEPAAETPKVEEAQPSAEAKSETAAPEVKAEAAPDQSAEAEEAAAAAAQPTVQKQAAVKRGKLQSRIDELVETIRQRDSASSKQTEELASLRAKLADVEAKASTKPETETKTESVVEAPTVEAFENYEDYVKAVARYEMTQAGFSPDAMRNEAKRVLEEERAKAAAEEAARRSEDAQKAAAKSYVESIELAKPEFPDFDEVVTNNKLPLTQTMVESILAAGQDGAFLAYQIGSNPERAAEVHGMGNSTQAALSMGAWLHEIRTARSAPKEAAAAPVVEKKVAVTSAPDPVTLVGGGGTPVSTVPPDQMNYRDFAAFRNKQLRERAGAR